MAVAIWLSAHLARRPAPRTLKELARPIGLVVGLFALLILAEPDLNHDRAPADGSGILFGSRRDAACPRRGGRPRQCAGLFAILLHPYQQARFLAFIHPSADPQGTGYQLAQAMGSARGGIFGRGLGQGIQKIHYLPEAHTDMIFAVIGEELGLVGVTVVIAAYAAFAYAGLRVALRCRDPFGKRLAAGLTAPRLRPGGDQPRGRARPRSADRDPAPVHLLRRR